MVAASVSSVRGVSGPGARQSEILKDRGWFDDAQAADLAGCFDGAAHSMWRPPKFAKAGVRAAGETRRLLAGCPPRSGRRRSPKALRRRRPATAFSITFTRWNSLWRNSITFQNRRGETVSWQFRGDIILEHLQVALLVLDTSLQARYKGRADKPVEA
jgi:hypothetical protein